MQLTASPDNTNPLGPCLVSSKLIPDPQNVQLGLTLNGNVVQDGTTAYALLCVDLLLLLMSHVVSKSLTSVKLSRSSPRARLSNPAQSSSLAHLKVSVSLRTLLFTSRMGIRWQFGWAVVLEPSLMMSRRKDQHPWQGSRGYTTAISPFDHECLYDIVFNETVVHPKTPHNTVC